MEELAYLRRWSETAVIASAMKIDKSSSCCRSPASHVCARAVGYFWQYNGRWRVSIDKKSGARGTPSGGLVTPT
jgi:hypothetical protein